MGRLFGLLQSFLQRIYGWLVCIAEGIDLVSSVATLARAASVTLLENFAPADFEELDSKWVVVEDFFCGRDGLRVRDG